MLRNPAALRSTGHFTEVQQKDLAGLTLTRTEGWPVRDTFFVRGELLLSMEEHGAAICGAEKALLKPFAL